MTSFENGLMIGFIAMLPVCMYSYTNLHKDIYNEIVFSGLIGVLSTTITIYFFKI